MKKRVVAYIRVSTQEQAEEGYSISEQQERLKKYSEAMGWSFIKAYVDGGFSGSNIKRPALTELIYDISSGGIDQVIVYKLDRLSRSQKDTLYLIEDVFLKNNVEFVSMCENFDTSTPFGRAMIGILSVFAQLEREQIKERMRMGHTGRAKEGHWRGGGGRPLGYDFIDGDLVINEYEALQIRDIYNMFLGGMNFHSIKECMKEKYTNRFSSWNNAGTISKVLKNRVYIGEIKFNKTHYKGVHEPIIDEKTFDTVQVMLKEIDRKLSPHYKSPFRANHLLSGMIFCGNCGARYFTHFTKRKDADKKYYYYVCYSRDGNKQMKKIDHCKNKNYKVEELDDIVINEILKISFDNNLIDEYRKNLEPINTSDNVRLEKKLKETDTQISKLLDLYQLGTISFEDISTRINSLNVQKNVLEQELKKLNIEEPILEKDEAIDLLSGAKDIFKKGTMEDKRKLINDLISKIIIYDDSIDIHWKFC